MKGFHLFFLISIVVHLVHSAKMPKPVTLRTEMNVKPADPKKTYFMQVTVSEDGRPVGIIVKQRGQIQNRRNQNKRKRKNSPRPRLNDEVPEIIGIRVPDSIDDAKNIYRNAIIVNNTLLMPTLLTSREKRNQKSLMI